LASGPCVGWSRSACRATVVAAIAATAAAAAAVVAAVGGKRVFWASRRFLLQGGSRATPHVTEPSKVIANTEAATSARRGPSGQKLKGPEQKTTAVDVPAPDSANPLRTPAIEAEHVHTVYDTIAEHWNHTRYKAWPRVDAFIRDLAPGSLVADLGCGNGKNIPAIREAGCVVIASDICAPLVQIACDSHSDNASASALVADCLCSPFRGGIFDAAISIAVLHHLSTEPRRVQALREAARLLRPGGRLLVYCWSYEQDEAKSRSRHRFVAQDVLVPWNYRTPTVKKVDKDKGKHASSKGPQQERESTSSSGPQQEASGWVEKPEVCQRYCHVYREGELDELLAKVPELAVDEVYFDTGNWCAIAHRRAD